MSDRRHHKSVEMILQELEESIRIQKKSFDSLAGDVALVTGKKYRRRAADDDTKASRGQHDDEEVLVHDTPHQLSIGKKLDNVLGCGRNKNSRQFSPEQQEPDFADIEAYLAKRVMAGGALDIYGTDAQSELENRALLQGLAITSGTIEPGGLLKDSNEVDAAGLLRNPQPPTDNPQLQAQARKSLMRMQNILAGLVDQLGFPLDEAELDDRLIKSHAFLSPDQLTFLNGAQGRKILIEFSNYCMELGFQNGNEIESVS